MENKIVYLLLEVVAKNGDVKRLTREGLHYKDIASLTNTLIIEELLIYDDEKVQLSEKGKAKHLELGRKFKELDKDKWIVKEEESQIEKFPKDFIYLPSQIDLDL